MVYKIQVVGTTPTTITVPDDYPTIQEAINHANAGDTVFVRNGTYYEHVCVNKTVSISGQDRNTTVIDGNQTGTVVAVTADNVNVSGFTVQNGEVGLDLGGDGNTVTSSMFSSNGAAEMALKADLEVYQDPKTYEAWHYPYGLMNGSYTEVMELTMETPVLSVEAFGHSDVESLLLGLFHDENMDGIPQLHEFIGFGCQDKNPWICLFGLPKGQYIIKIKGEEVTGNPGHFDRKITRYRGYGIGTHSCLNSTLSENLIYGNYAGLYLQSSSGMVVHSNNVTRNIGGIVAENMTNSIFCSNRVFANTPSDTYSTGISIRAAENVNLSSNVVSHNAFGINIWNSTNTNIENNEIYSHSGWAVELHASYGNKVASNCISNVSTLDGIRLMFSSGNSLTGNNITACEHSGILLWHDCDNNTATCNNIQFSGSLGILHGHGVEILLSHNNTFADNVFSHGDNQGLLTIESSDTSVIGNLVVSNRKGIVLRDSVGSHVYHNNIINNSEQQGYDDTVGNSWDNGYPSGGNYWSDYSGADLQSGPYQNDSCSDGLGDTPYAIDSNKIDNFPLMKPYAGINDLGVEVPELKTVVPEGYNSTVWVNVTVLNYGIQAETSNLTLQIGKTVQEHVLSLMERNSTTLAFSLNVSDWAKGNYPLSVHALPLPSEMDTADNDYDGVLVVSILGDINGDFAADVYDAIILANAYNSKPGSSNWNPNADINGNNVVDIYDAIILANHYNQHYP
jgi:parallel beta-helix repeat protein